MSVANTAWGRPRFHIVDNHVKKLLVNITKNISIIPAPLSSLSSCLIPGSLTGGNIKCEHYEL